MYFFLTLQYWFSRAVQNNQYQLEYDEKVFTTLSNLSLRYRSAGYQSQIWGGIKTLKKIYGPFLSMGSTASRLQSHYEETVYFLPSSSQEFMVLNWSTSEGWKAELTLEPPSVLNPRPLDWESSPLTTMPLLHIIDLLV